MQAILKRGLEGRQLSGILRFMADDDESAGSEPVPFSKIPSAGDDLPYKVELWDERRASVETVLAVTASGSIGYAAFYAATREFPQRYITLRHKNSIVSRWNGPAN